jgi:hypothetical protein
MTFPSAKLHPEVLWFLLRERWLKYWIDTRLTALLDGSGERPMDFESWWQSLPGLRLPFTPDPPPEIGSHPVQK